MGRHVFVVDTIEDIKELRVVAPLNSGHQVGATLAGYNVGPQYWHRRRRRACQRRGGVGFQPLGVRGDQDDVSPDFLVLMPAHHSL